MVEKSKIGKVLGIRRLSICFIQSIIYILVELLSTRRLPQHYPIQVKSLLVHQPLVEE